MANLEKLPLKLLMDKEKNRVVFAESNKDFVDILFSFLTLPLGTIIRLVGKKSSLSCFNKLYESIKNLDKDCLSTEACRSMLLQPRSAAEEHCDYLKINVNDLKPRRFYRCPEWLSHCGTKAQVLYSSVTGARCHCGETMTFAMERLRTISVEDSSGVFSKGGAIRYIISDDYKLMEASTAHCITLINKLGIRDGAILEERDVEVGPEEILNLLARFLMSKAPLSEVFLGCKKAKATITDAEKLKRRETTQTNKLTDTNKEPIQIDLKILVNKDNGKVLYAEAKQDFINLLFSFLTFPLGSIIKFLHGQTSLWCVDNLYRSVESLTSSVENFVKSKECNTLLLNPKLAPLFGCSNQILRMDEIAPENIYSYNNVTNVLISAMNPKSPLYGTEVGGSFVKQPSRFLVTGNLEVTPMSAIAVFNLVNRLQVPITNLEERNVKLGETEALNILKASLISHNALNYAFSLMKKTGRNLALNIFKASMLSHKALNYACYSGKRRRKRRRYLSKDTPSDFCLKVHTR